MTNPIRSALLAAAVALAPAMSGCGGGGSSGTPPVTSDADKLSRLLPNAQNAFTPLNVNVDRDFTEGASSVGLTTETYMKSISGDDTGGFRVTYVVDGTEKAVHFTEDDYRTMDEGDDETDNFYKKEVDGTDYSLWSATGAFDNKPRNDGSTEFRYFDINGWEITDVAASQRGYSAYGARTETLPASGSATYHGRVRAEAWRSDSPANNPRLDRMLGGLLLSADFREATVGGRIHALQRYDSSDLESDFVPVYGHVEISNGVIADGQFTADLVGRPESGASPDQSTTHGIEGDLLGEFYGPAAEEVGGVLSASQGDLVYQGYIGGRQVADRRIATLLPDADNSFMPLNVGVDVDYTESAWSVGLTTETYVKSISGDDAGGLRVTYVVDGAEKEVHFTDADYEAGTTEYGYEKEVDGTNYHLWSGTGAFSHAPRNDGSPSEYAYFDVNEWWTNPTGPGSFTGYSVYGVRTETLPRGTASYAGRVFADSYRADVPNDLRLIDGELALTANFGNSTIEGTIDRLRQDASSMSGRVDVLSGRINDGEFTATLAGVDTTSAALATSSRGLTGKMDGEFFGPGAEEIGGVFSATRDADDTVMYGWFGGRKQ